MVSKTLVVTGAQLDKGEYLYHPAGKAPIPSNIVRHAQPPNLRKPKAVVMREQKSGQAAVQTAVSMAVSMARQNAFERGQDAMALVPYESRTVTELAMLKVAQQLNNQGARADDMMREGRMQLFQQMQMQQHFGRQSRDAQNGIMNGIIGFVASMQDKESHAMASLMGQNAAAAMQHAESAKQMATQLAATVARGQGAASDMANRLANAATEANATASKAIDALAARVAPQVGPARPQARVDAGGPPSHSEARRTQPRPPARVTRSAGTIVRETETTIVKKDDGGGAGIAITAAATIALVLLALNAS